MNYRNNILFIIFVALFNVCYASKNIFHDKLSLRCNLPYSYVEQSSGRDFIFMETQNEIWKDVVGYEGLYMISNIGNVKSLDRTIIANSKNGNKFSLSFNGRNKAVANYFGYIKVLLSKKAKYKWHTVHGLVANAFIPNPDNKPQINHINGIKTDNRVENLEWVTAKENTQHAIRTGLSIRKSGWQNKNGTPVYQYSRNGDFIKKYPSAFYAQKTGAFCSVCITRCCKNESSCHRGYFWSHSFRDKDFFSGRKVKYVETKKRIAKIDKNGQIVSVYNSLKEIDGHSGAIGDCCRGKIPFYKKFKYQYID